LTNEELLIAIKADTTNLMSGLKAAGTGMDNLTTKISSVGKGMTIVGAAIVGAFAMAIKTASGFEQSMANTASVAGATAEELTRMSNAAREMGKESIYSASQAADAMYYLASAGLEVDQVIGALSGTMLLAAATQSDLAYTSEAITATLSQYNLAAEEATRVANVFAAAISGSQATMVKLKESMTYVGPMAKSMGISLEETAGILMNLYNAGLEGAAAGTALRMAFAKLLDPTKDTADAMGRLKVSITDSAGQMRPFKDIIDDLGKAGMTAADAMQIFGIRAGPGMLALVSQGEGAIEKMTEKITDTNKAAEMAAIQMDTFKGAVKLLKSAFEELQIIIANHIMPTLSKMVKWLTNAINAVSAWMEKNKLLADIVIKVGAAIGIIAAVGGPILMAVKTFMLLKGALVAVGVAMKALFISSGPIGWLILAAIALSLAWESNFGGIRDFTLFVVDKIKEALGWLYDKVIWVAEKLGLLKEKSEEAITLTTDLVEAVKEVGEETQEAVTGVDSFADAMEGLETQTDNTKEALNEFGQAIETFDEWVARLAKETEEANKKMADEAEKAMERYENAMQPVEDRLYELSHTEEEVAARNLLTRKNYLEAVIKTAGLTADHEKAELTKIKEWYTKEIDLIKAKLVEQQNALIETANKTEESANIQKAAVKSITDEYTGLINKIDAVGKAVEEAAKKAASEAFLAATPTIAETGYVPDYIPKLKTGASYISKTGLALIHEGEGVLDPVENKAYQSGARSITVHINNPVVRNDDDISKIRQQFEEAINGLIPEFGRSGNYTVPGMA